MPRVALTDQQRRDLVCKDISRQILEEMNAQRGRKNQTREEFSEMIGISHDTWGRWNRGSLMKASFGSVLDAIQRAGLTVSIEVAPPIRKR